MLASDAFLDFIYVGTPRAGSTWLRTVLHEHPEIRLRDFRALPPGIDADPCIAGLDSDDGLARYRSLFDGAMPYTVIGDIVNVAARLEAIARPNQVLLGERTHELVGDAFELRDLGPHALTGRSEQTRVFELAFD